MLKLIAFVQAYTSKENGATAIEYALIASGIALLIVSAVYLFGEQLKTTFTDMKDTLATGPAP
jgi:pilus assembly protein Flp/PilA